jgi:two-component system chemotaxis response regulator CheB
MPVRANRLHALPESNGVHADTAAAVDVVAIVGSIGGPEALREVVSGLPSWFPAAILAVQHRTVVAEDVTVTLLQRSARLEVVLAREQEKVRASVIYVTTADGRMSLDEDGRFMKSEFAALRPADALFASVARRYGGRAVGVILSGGNDDGAAGVIALKRAGARIIVQNRQSARCFTMPSAAIATGCVDLALPADRIAHALVSLVSWPGAASLLHAPLASWAKLD